MTKKILWIAGIMLLAGSLLATSAWAMGAHTSLHWDRGFQVAERNVRETIDQTLSAFERIELNIPVARVTVRYGDDFQVEGYSYRELTVEQRGGTLFVEASSLGWSSQIHLGPSRLTFGPGGGGGTRADRVTITVPRGTALDSVNLSVDVGNIQVRDLSIRNAVFTIDVGNIDLSFPGAEDRHSYSGTVGVGRISIDGEHHGGIGSTVSRMVENPESTIRFEAGVGDVSISFQGS